MSYGRRDIKIEPLQNSPRYETLILYLTNILKNRI